MTMAGSPVEPGGEDRASAVTRSAGLVGRSLTLEDFVAFNDEVRSFLRAGIPIDVGFRGTAARTDHLLKEVAERVAERTASGQSLLEAITAEGTIFPAEYRALLVAGMRAGRLPEALASVSDLGASISRLQRQLRLSLIYPATVVTISFGLLVGVMVFVVPQLERTHEVFRIQESAFMRSLLWLSDTVGIWGIGIPAAVVGTWVLMAITRRLTGKGTWPAGGRWLPGARDVAVTQFARVLSVLVEFSVPLGEALRLSGDSCGSSGLRDAANVLADETESGTSLPTALANARQMPSFLRWLMAVGLQRGSLSASLSQAAGVYEQRALARLDRFRRIVPPAVVLIFGGLVTLTYALLVFVPVTELLRSLGGHGQ